MKSLMVPALLTVLVASSLLGSGDACLDPQTREMLARMRMQQTLSMYPSIYQDIMNGRLSPNGSNQNQQGAYPNQQGYNQQMPNQQGYNQQGTLPNQQGVLPNQQGYNQQLPNQQGVVPNQQGVVPNQGYNTNPQQG